ncbi:MAG: TorF family putative porin [Lysobacterales bacterium]
MWRRYAGGFLFVAGAGIGTTGVAQDFAGSLGLASDNVYRGISLNAGRPAWLADLHYAIGPDWVVGIGASSERIHHRAPGAQLTAYLDRRWQVDGDWAAKVGAVHYDSPAEATGRRHYDELNAAIGWRGRWQAILALSPDMYGPYHPYAQPRHGVAVWAETTWHQPLAARLAFDAGVGYADLERIQAHSYGYANLGLSYGVGDTHLYVSRIWTGPTAATQTDTVYYRGDTPVAPVHSHWVASLIWAF